MKFQLFTQQSPWFSLLCLAVGAIYAFALYQKKPQWDIRLNYILAACRFLLVALLCFLLLSPFIRQNRNTYEKPTVVLAIDNSRSVGIAEDSLRRRELLGKLATTATQLQSAGVEVEIQSFNEEKTSAQNLVQLPFTGNTTNLSQLLNTIQSNYEGRNLASVVLVTDGIYNQGISPTYLKFNHTIHTVGLGDTVPKQDVNLKTVYYNKVAYLGNKFPMLAEIHSKGFANRTITVLLKQNGKVLERKPVVVKQDQQISEVNFYASSERRGMQHYTVEVEPLPGEFTTRNNVKDAYIDVIDGKEKILLIALSPHPDIKAIKSIVEKNENYQFETFVIGTPGAPKETKYDLVIAHQVPDNYNVGSSLVKKFADQGTPVWYILGSQSNLGQLNASNRTIAINGRPGQFDKVTPAFNPAFSLFKVEANQSASLIAQLPPVAVPFGDYRVVPGSEVILFQKIGNLVTNKPLLVVSTQKNQKSGVMVGDALWQWRLEEYALTEKQEVIDELVLKLIQFLSSKEDKRKLRVYPVNEEFYDFEKVVFEAEVYNDIYEKIYDQKINLAITGEDNKVRSYSFTTSQSNSRFNITGLPQGVYRYKASATVLGKAQTSEGEFTVKEMQLEALNTTADHTLLRQLAQQSSGRFFLPQQVDQLQSILTSNKPPDIIQTNEELLEIINLKWIFFLLLFLATVEWGLRKYSGGY